MRSSRSDVTFLAHTPMGGPFAVGSHHLARAMAADGLSVTHISLPVTPMHLARINDPIVRMRLRRFGRGSSEQRDLLDLVPLGLVPSEAFLRMPSMAGLAGRTVVPRPRRFEQRILFVDHPSAWVAARRMQADLLIYRPTDVYQHLNGGRVKEVERQVLAACDGVVATSEVVAASCRDAGFRGPILTVPNGVGPAAPPSPADEAALLDQIRTRAGGRPVVLYVGALDDRFDGRLLGELAAGHPNALFVVIGPDTARDPSWWGDGVLCLGPQPPALARAAMREAHIGLMPFSDHEANQGRSPMKVLELVADGCHVVARSTPPLIAMDALLDGSLQLYATPEEASDQLDVALATARPGPQSLPEAFTWQAKAREILAFADGLVA